MRIDGGPERIAEAAGGRGATRARQAGWVGASARSQATGPRVGAWRASRT